VRRPTRAVADISLFRVAVGGAAATDTVLVTTCASYVCATLDCVVDRC
jgi:hypothetical protein